jgi:glycosyltransferase involved in cell wall biosynthesis/SAM-dependent methyltransferase
MAEDVTIVIPCYQQGRFLAAAIKSALGQTHPGVEVIVVDDGSTDETAEVAKAHPVTLLQQENAGLSAARNAGLAEATTEYVAFLDADDLLRPGAIATGLAVFRDRPEAAFVAGQHVEIDADGQLIGAVQKVPLTGDPYLAFLRGNLIGMHATVLYRRSAVVAAGGFDTSLAACEDYDLYLRLARRWPVVQHDEVVADYRRHDANMTNNPSFMLSEVLGLLHRELPRVVENPARLAAYRDGLWNWTSYYLGELEAGPRPAAYPTAVPPPVVPARRRLKSTVKRALRGQFVPRVGKVRMGHLRRIHPISGCFGFDRGRPVDRHYIEGFLARHADDVRGRVLEIGDDSYTRAFGGDRVSTADVLHVIPDFPGATFTGSLEDEGVLPEAAFDCIVLTQTLHIIYDIRAALASVASALRPGGVLLATVPGISQVDRDDWGSTWSWAITPYAFRRLLTDAFPDARIEVAGHGNVLAATAFLHGLADRELRPAELAHNDPAYPLLVTARVVAGP